MTEGYLYCFSNESMPGILKIGMTERHPQERLKEANGSDTWRPPTPYVMEFAKKVANVKDKEKTLHMLLKEFNKRINPKREFFSISKEVCYGFFELIDGDYLWPDEDSDEEEIYSLPSENIMSSIISRQCFFRDMKYSFKEGQLIRHMINKEHIWVATYNAEKNCLLYDNEVHSMSSFARTHHRSVNPSRKSANGWAECEALVNDNWISTSSMGYNNTSSEN
jgi:hypothetical protein